jgi:hypothetical protein
MRFLDLDLDFFLNDNAYRSGSDSGRLSSTYKPWSASRVRRFVEERCGLSRDTPVPGRTVESHDEVLLFWRTLIESGSLRVPFEVIHVDAHPDLWVGDGLYLISEFLFVDSEPLLAMLGKKYIHSGNYLTFAIAYRWIASLVWVYLRRNPEGLPEWDGDARSSSLWFKNRKRTCARQQLPLATRGSPVPFRIVPWRTFRTGERFDYISFCKSPEFTPPESDELIPVIEEYIQQI